LPHTVYYKDIFMIQPCADKPQTAARWMWKNLRVRFGRHPRAGLCRRWWWDCWGRWPASRRSDGPNTGFECGSE